MPPCRSGRLLADAGPVGQDMTHIDLGSSKLAQVWSNTCGKIVHTLFKFPHGQEMAHVRQRSSDSGQISDAGAAFGQRLDNFGARRYRRGYLGRVASSFLVLFGYLCSLCHN